jgi:hypothetical protein
MENGLPRVPVAVQHHPITRVGVAPLRSDLFRNQNQVADQLPVLRLQIVDRRDVIARHDENMRWGLGVDVLDGEGELIAVHELGRDLFIADLAEQAVGHGILAGTPVVFVAMPVKVAAALVEAGKVPPETMEAALKKQVLAGGAIDTVLLEMGAASESDLLTALGVASGAAVAPPLLLARPDPKAMLAFPAKLAERHGIVPLLAEGRVLHIASVYPIDARVLEEISFMIGRDLRPRVGVELRIRQAIAKVYQRPLAARFAALAALLAGKSTQEPAAALDASELGDRESLGAAVVRAAELAPETNQDVFANVPPVQRKNPFQRPADQGTPRSLESWRVAETARSPLTPGHVEAGSPRPSATAPKALDVTGYDEAEPAPRPPPPASLPLPVPPAAEEWKVVEPASAPSAGLPSATDEVLGWSLDQARKALEQAGSRDEVIDLALRFGLGTFEFIAAFALSNGNAFGWDARGRDPDARSRVEQIAIPLDLASMLNTVAATRGRYLGPAPNDPNTAAILDELGRGRPDSVLLFPVEIRERVVSIIYGDCGKRPISTRRAADFILFAQHIGRALERLILSRKWELAKSAPTKVSPASAGALERDEAGTRLDTPQLLSRRRTVTRDERTAARPVPKMEDLFAAVERLVGPDPEARSGALGELLALPEFAAAALVARFPGPISFGRAPMKDLPLAEEIGPIPSALAKMGQAGARALLPLLSHVDVKTRFYAVLTAGSLPFEILVAPIFQRTLDPDPDVASAARVAATAFSGLSGFSVAVELLREELSSGKLDRAALAALALAQVHDMGSIDRLIDLTDKGNRSIAGAAAQALSSLTRQNFGTATRKWRSWWAENRSRRREEWLIAALRHGDLDIRTSAFEELLRRAPDPKGYVPDASRRDREAAALRWEEWWRREGSKAR